MVVTSSSGEDEDVEASSRRMSNARSFESLKRHARQSASTAEAESIKLLVVVVVILIIVRIYMVVVISASGSIFVRMPNLFLDVFYTSSTNHFYHQLA